MNAVQLREQVIDKIYGIDDVDYLDAINKILDVKDRGVYHLSRKQRELIELGKQQIERGEFVTNEELEAEEDKWLSE